MTESNNNQSKSLLSTAFGLAKKLSTTSLSALSHVAPGTVSTIRKATQDTQTIEGSARLKNPLEVEKYTDPQHMLREHLPGVTQQLLGRHYNKVYSVASFFSPDINNKISDYLFTHLNDFTEQTTSVKKVLDEAGAKSLAELQTNPERSGRISQALIEQNKIIAAVQGGVTGATGVIGAAVDVPLSLALALRTIYQTGRAHGFDLHQYPEQEIVEFIFKEMDLDLVAEKQTLLLGLKALKDMLQTHNVYQLQQILGSDNDTEALKHWLLNDDGELKYKWMGSLSKISAVAKLTPIAGATLSAVYSWRLIEDAGQKSQAVFGAARHYINEHPDETILPLQAYFALEKQLQKPKALSVPESNQTLVTKDQAEPALLSEVVVPTTSENIAQVTVKPRKPRQPKEKQEQQTAQQVEEGIHTLAEKHVEPHESSEQQPALTEQSLAHDLSEAEESLEVVDKKVEKPNKGNKPKA